MRFKVVKVGENSVLIQEQNTMQPSMRIDYAVTVTIQGQRDSEELAKMMYFNKSEFRNEMYDQLKGNSATLKQIVSKLTTPYVNNISHVENKPLPNWSDKIDKDSDTILTNRELTDAVRDLRNRLEY
jgi:hypothetical protein